jgi:hypothetical protein
MTEDVIEMMHLDRKREAANIFAKFCKMDCPEKLDAWNSMLLSLYHFLVNNNGMEEAAHLLWRPKLFDPRPKCTKDVWELFDRSNMGLLMGAASMSKSYTMGVRLFLEWTRDPSYTTVSVLGPSADHLERNLFSHIVRLHQNAALPMPGEIGELFLGLSRRDRASSIAGVVIPIGKHKKAGRLQGAKRFPRIKKHKEFGDMSRMFIFLDEIENIPEGIWSDIDNLISGVTDDKSSIKIFGAFNPTDPSAEVASRAEPPCGWANIDPDKDYKWTSIRGWDVLRLDAMTSENVIQNKTIYEGLQTRAGIARIARNAGGLESPGYMSMVRAMYPTVGATLTIFAPGVCSRMKGEFIWYDRPTPVASVDLALEGKASACFSYGLFGATAGKKLPATLELPNGVTKMFREEMSGFTQPRYGLLLKAQFPLPKGDTEAMYLSVREMCHKLKVKPEHLCVDRTGNGAGVHDLLRHRWNLAVQGVNYSAGATERKIMAEDLQTPKEEYERIVTELLFALQKWAEFDYLLIDPQVDTSKLFEQMVGRRYRVSGKKTKAEAKANYISRGKDSPDEMDSFSLLVHCVRVAWGIMLSTNNDPDYMPDVYGADTDPHFVDETNMMQTLEEMEDEYL